VVAGHGEVHRIMVARLGRSEGGREGCGQSGLLVTPNSSLLSSDHPPYPAPPSRSDRLCGEDPSPSSRDDEEEITNKFGSVAKITSPSALQD
jgi:hypothetical protein